MDIQDHAVFLEVVVRHSNVLVRGDDEILRLQIGNLTPYEDGENWRFTNCGDLVNADGSPMHKSEIPLLLVKNSNNQHATKSAEAMQIADMVTSTICRNDDWEVVAWRIAIAWNGIDADSSIPSDATIH